MKHSFRYLIPVALVLFQACNPDETKSINTEEETPSGPVSISVTIDQGTRASVAETTGAITFSKGDAIKIFNGTGVYLGITQSTESTGMFSMAEGFSATGSGYAGFPASLVTNITSDGVTFVLPSSYKYSQVGGSDANTSKVPCPMMGEFTAGGGISLKPVCALVRFYFTDIAAGNLYFCFNGPVSGKATIESIPSGANDGIKQSVLGDVEEGWITVTDVPEVEKGDYIYITLPVPVGTDPSDISLINRSKDGAAYRWASVAGGGSPLGRATGHKIMDFTFKAVETVGSYGPFTVSPGKAVYIAPGNLMAHVSSYNSPVGTVDEWKFGEPLENLGHEEGSGNFYLYNNDSRVVGKWVDLFIWQGATVSHYNRVQGVVSLGICSATTEADDIHIFKLDKYLGDGSDLDEFPYTGFMSTQNKNEFPATGGYIHITNGGHYDWRLPDANEIDYLMSQREGAVVGGQSGCRFALVTIEGKKYLLLFPDSDTEIWKTNSMGQVPANINGAGYNSFEYTKWQWMSMQEAGMVVLPQVDVIMSDEFQDGTTQSYYWTETGYFVLQIGESHVGAENVWPTEFACPVRLVRDE